MQYFRLSGGKIHSPLITEIIQFGKEVGNRTGIVSTRYGKRMLSTVKSMPLDSIAPDVFVEIADYDPIKNNLMFIGEQPPSDLVAVHWIILGARREVNAIVHLCSRERITNPLEKAKEILSILKADNYIFRDKEEVLFLGKSLADTVDRIRRYLDAD